MGATRRLRPVWSVPVLAGLILLPALFVNQPTEAAEAGAVEVVVGSGHACARTTTGNVYCWGDNRYGQLGGLTEADQQAVAVPVPGLRNVTDLAAGAFHTCAVHDGGKVACWGRNDSGQLGNGSTRDSATAVTAIGLTGVTQVTAGRAHSCAVAGTAPNQRVWCWGANGFGQLGLGSVQDAEFRFSVDPAGTALGYDGVDVDDAGRIVAASTQNPRVWSVDDRGLLVDTWRISAGGVWPGAVAASGGGSAWTADPRPSQPNLYRLTPGGAVSPAITVTDPVMACSAQAPCQVPAVAALPNGDAVVAVVRTGSSPASWLRRYTPAATPVGSPVLVTGLNGAVVSDLAVGKTTTGADAVFVAGGERVGRYTTSLVYQTDFSVRHVGDPCGVRDDYEETGRVITPGNPIGQYTYRHRISRPVSIRIGTGNDGELTMLLDYELVSRDGTFSLPNSPPPSPPQDTGANYSQVSVEAQPECLVTVENSGGGQGNLTGIPGDVSAGTDLHGARDAVGLVDGGMVISDGPSGARPSRLLRLDATGGDDPTWGQVSFRSVPTAVVPELAFRQITSFPDEVTQVSAGAHHTCVSTFATFNVSEDNNLLCWGNNGSGQLGLAAGFGGLTLGLSPNATGDTTSYPVVNDLPGLPAYRGVVQAGGNHSCQQRSTQVICWGADDAGQLGGTPADEGAAVLQNLTTTSLSLGRAHSCGIVAGKVQCWGSNDLFQLGPAGGSLTAATQVSAGRATTCAVQDSQVWCWGDRESDQIPGGPGTSYLPADKPVRVVLPSPWSTVYSVDTLTSPILLQFSLPASGVTTDNVVLRSSSSGTRRPAALTCQRADRTNVSCASSSVTWVLLTPASPWTPGGYYTVEVNPPGSTPVTVGGVAVETVTHEFRGPTVIGESSTAVRASWRTVTATPALGGSYLQERTARATLRYRFNGSAVSLITTNGPSSGKANVKIDARAPVVLDLYAPRLTYKVSKAFANLGGGAHTVTVTVLGTKRAAASGTTVGVDGFKVGATTVNTPSVATSWAARAVTGATEGRVIQSGNAGSSASMTFDGTGITWRTLAGPDQGSATILIDGARVARVSNHAAATSPVARLFDGLADARHTITIVVDGAGPGPRDLVSIDGFEVQ